MEAKVVRKHSVLSKPILAGILLILWGVFLYQGIGGIPVALKNAPIWCYLIPTAFGVLGYGIHRFWFRGEFKGNCNRNCFQDKDVRNAFILVAAVDVVMCCVSLAVYGVEFSMKGLLIALMAGVCEELVYRSLPVSVMMRDWMSEKRIPVIAVFTSVVFGLIHFGNISAGSSFLITGYQAVCAACIGVFFAAVYLRTGNILLTIVFHTVHDMLCLLAKGSMDLGGAMSDAYMNPLEITTGTILAVLTLAAGLYLMRKSVRPQIVALWKERWGIAE